MDINSMPSRECDTQDVLSSGGFVFSFCFFMMLSFSLELLLLSNIIPASPMLLWSPPRSAYITEWFLQRSPLVSLTTCGKTNCLIYFTIVMFWFVTSKIFRIV